MSLPIYPWFDQAPEHLKTKNQLAELGLKPGGPIRAKVVWKRGKNTAYLYNVQEAVAKKPLTARQAAARDAAKLARRTCPVCRRVFEHVLGMPTCQDCWGYKPSGKPEQPDGTFEVHEVQPHYTYRVWLPADAPIAPYAAPVPEQKQYYFWIPEPKSEFRLLLEARDYGPRLPGHTHTWFYGQHINEWLELQTVEMFAAAAARWPILREWAIDASLPGERWLDYALAGLDEAGQARYRTEWFIKHSLWGIDTPVEKGVLM